MIEALKNLGFDEYIQPLQIYLDKYRQVRNSPLTSFICSLSHLSLELSHTLALTWISTLNVARRMSSSV